MAVRAFQSVDASGLARVDFLMDPKTESIYLNEINTMPGFTTISMYPKLRYAEIPLANDVVGGACIDSIR